tara:strand:+ start:1010 stop:1297 length:288 start_codon:yes stop_codon:yes gene_type:complete
MNPHFLYIIFSKTINRFYIGETNNLKNRIIQHQEHYFKSNFSKAATDWVAVLSKVCNSKEDALFLEKFIKRMKSKKFIFKIIESPEILDDILNSK